MNIVQTWSDSLERAFEQLAAKIGDILPNLFFAFVILLFGWILSLVLAKIVKKIFRSIKLDELADKYLFKKYFNKEVDISLIKISSKIVKWFTLFVVLIAIADTLNLPQISEFILGVIAYIPNIIAAVIILAIGIFVSNILESVIKNSANLAKIASSELIAVIAKWSVLIFTFLAALSQLNIARNMIQILFGGIVITLSLILGLSFGLGGKDTAKRILENLTKDDKKLDD